MSHEVAQFCWNLSCLQSVWPAGDFLSILMSANIATLFVDMVWVKVGSNFMSIDRLMNSKGKKSLRCEIEVTCDHRWSSWGQQQCYYECLTFKQIFNHQQQLTTARETVAAIWKWARVKWHWLAATSLVRSARLSARRLI